MCNISKILLGFVLSSYSLISFSLPNPASVNCTQKGGQFVLIKNTGICIFKDGSYCEEWSYYKNKCVSGKNTFPGGSFDRNNIKQYCIAKYNKQSVVVLCKKAK